MLGKAKKKKTNSPKQTKPEKLAHGVRHSGTLAGHSTGLKRARSRPGASRGFLCLPLSTRPRRRSPHQFRVQTSILSGRVGCQNERGLLLAGLCPAGLGSHHQPCRLSPPAGPHCDGSRGAAHGPRFPGTVSSSPSSRPPRRSQRLSRITAGPGLRGWGPPSQSQPRHARLPTSVPFPCRGLKESCNPKTVQEPLMPFKKARLQPDILDLI